MIYLYSALFGYVNIIAFQLTERIAITEKSMKSVLGHCKNMLGFSYLAIPTRHDKSIKPHLYDINRISLKPLIIKTAKITDVALNLFKNKSKQIVIYRRWHMLSLLPV